MDDDFRGVMLTGQGTKRECDLQGWGWKPAWVVTCSFCGGLRPLPELGGRRSNVHLPCVWEESVKVWCPQRRLRGMYVCVGHTTARQRCQWVAYFSYNISASPTTYGILRPLCHDSYYFHHCHFFHHCLPPTKRNETNDDERRRTTNDDERRTTNDERRTTNDERRRTTNDDERRTNDDERRTTTNDERRRRR